MRKMYKKTFWNVEIIFLCFEFNENLLKKKIIPETKQECKQVEKDTTVDVEIDKGQV